MEYRQTKAVTDLHLARVPVWMAIALVVGFWMFVESIWTELFFIVGALWVIFGLFAADVILQQAGDWSPLGIRETDKGETFAGSQDYAPFVTFRGTTFSLRDIATNIMNAMNTAVPFDALGMGSLVSSRSGGQYDPRHWGLLGAWFTAPVIAMVGLAFLLRIEQRLMGTLAAGILLLLATAWFLARKGVATEGGAGPARKMFAFLMKGIGIATLLVCLVAPLAQLTAGWQNVRAAGASPELLIWLGVILSAIVVAMGVMTKVALWLGWYTNDIRVNLLEPAIRRLWWIALLAGTSTVVAAWHAVEPAAWGLSCLLLVVALIGRLLPLPPRLSNFVGRDDYVLLVDGGLVEYGDWESSVRAGLPRMFLNRSHADLVAELEHGARLANEFLATGRAALTLPVRSVTFNSANLHTHLTRHPLLQIMLFLGALAGLALIACLAAHLAGSMAALLPVIGSPDHPISIRAGTATLALAVTLFALGSFLAARAALRRHAIALAFAHARGDLAQCALDCVQSYQQSVGQAAPRWKVIADLSKEFDEEFERLSAQEARALDALGNFSGIDNLHLTGQEAWQDRLSLLGVAQAARSGLLTLCETLPEEVRHRLAFAHIPAGVVAEAEQAWRADLTEARAFSLMRLRRIGAELNALRWLAGIRNRFSVGYPGQLPEFSEPDHFQMFAVRLASIVRLKEAELAVLQTGHGAPRWLPAAHGVNPSAAARITSLQKAVAEIMAASGNAVKGSSRPMTAFTDRNAGSKYVELQMALVRAVSLPEGTEQSPGGTGEPLDGSDPTGGAMPAPYLNLRREFLQAACDGDAEAILALMRSDLREPGRRERSLSILQSKVLPYFTGSAFVGESFEHGKTPDDDRDCEYDLGTLEKDGVTHEFLLTYEIEDGVAVICEAFVKP